MKVKRVKQTETIQPRVSVLKRAEKLNVWIHKNSKEFYAKMKDGSLIQMTDQELKVWLL